MTMSSPFCRKTSGTVRFSPDLRPMVVSNSVGSPDGPAPVERPSGLAR